MKIAFFLSLVFSLSAFAADDCKIYLETQNGDDSFALKGKERLKETLIAKGYELTEEKEELGMRIYSGFICNTYRCGASYEIYEHSKEWRYYSQDNFKYYNKKPSDAKLEEIFEAKLEKALAKLPRCEDLDDAIKRQESKRKFDEKVDGATSWIYCLDPARFYWSRQFGMSCKG